ncbi:MAG TPA: tryptophan 7-halogenase, partial [Polyangiaceae bacterium]
SELGMKEMDPYLKNFAVFSHYQGAERHSGEREGDIAVVLVPEGWWWVIPLAKDRTSVGLVAPKRALGGRKPDEAYFLEKIENTPYLKKRFGGATRVAPVRTVSDYSFVCRRLCGDRWLLVGDAAAFIDPVFSTGVYLGMQGAFHAAEAISSALARRSFGRRSFAAYERWLSRAVGVYRDFVKGFYSPEFAEALMHPSDRLQLRQAVTSLLAGRGVGCFEVTWRVWVFKTLARANRRLNLMPRLPGRREAYQAFSQGVASTR